MIHNDGHIVNDLSTLSIKNNNHTKMENNNNNNTDLVTNNNNVIIRNGIKIIISPRKPLRSPSKVFTKLIKRDSDTSVLTKSPTKKTSTTTVSLSTTDEAFEYSSTSEFPLNWSASSDESTDNLPWRTPIQERSDIFTEYYVMGPQLGEGASCKVYLVTEKRTQRKYAAKVIPTYKIFRKGFSLISKEISIVKYLDHPNIIKMYDCFCTEQNVYIIMEYVRGYELFDEIVQRKYLSELESRTIIHQILNALSYLHTKNIAHRDLKPENIKFLTTDANSPIKVLDFGFARYLSKNDDQENCSQSLPVGTLGYESPEILLNKANNCASDIWSLGIICYILLCGYPPFFSFKSDRSDLTTLDNSPFWILFNEDTPYLRKSILKSKFSFSTYHWEFISNEAKDFITQCLIIDPNKRLTSIHGLSHPWFQLDL
ncbi:putative protein serine/threonine kinase [Tieghemostelium lacteum]|uniref:non-specific serine/threonine protein kinase n=1 Tax=Tieghemostelium lacteum TaxID=361077 RepID=A0A152A6X3_TIELA|nr:putative protein serine/threonine kinase [Tieghemostelium lacteum]|eukprot:KYR01992.1 putative protein serine/threonine kinase [Tieghemostelium lacteum]